MYYHKRLWDGSVIQEVCIYAMIPFYAVALGPADIPRAYEDAIKSAREQLYFVSLCRY